MMWGRNIYTYSHSPLSGAASCPDDPVHMWQYFNDFSSHLRKKHLHVKMSHSPTKEAKLRRFYDPCFVSACKKSQLFSFCLLKFKITSENIQGVMLWNLTSQPSRRNKCWRCANLQITDMLKLFMSLSFHLYTLKKTLLGLKNFMFCLEIPDYVAAKQAGDLHLHFKI